ncbi:hypothetical protein PI126_g707 [Phytophthora idaei]|nr:hypothetical protein PI126_g707 [Phytophthora idaei]
MPRRHRRQSTMDRFLVGGEAAASYRRDRWSARPLVEERCVLQALTEYEVADQNKFSCRPKRVLDEDEIPECNCHRGRDWSVTCGIGCENRSIQVECVRGSCATGGHCSNQQMQDGSNALLSRTLWTSGSDPTQHRRTRVQHQMVKPSQNSRAAKAARRVLAALGTQRSETPRKKRRTNAAPVEAVEAENTVKRLARHEETMKRNAVAQLQPRGVKHSKIKTKARHIDDDRSEDAKAFYAAVDAPFLRRGRM